MKALVGKWLIFVVLMSVTVLLAGDWRRADYWLLAGLFVPKEVKGNDKVLLIELPDVDPDDASSKAFRELLGRTLAALAQRRPAQVGVDIAVMEGGAALPAVAEGISALHTANVPVYFGILPDVDPAALAGSIYRESALTGVGHTELQLGAGLAVFRSVVKQGSTGKEYPFLPALLAEVDAWNLPEYRVFRVPRVRTAPLGLRIDADLEQLPSRLAGFRVIVASSERECRAHRSGDGSALCPGPGSLSLWSGPELLVWSLSDLLAMGEGKALQPVNQPLWVLASALCAAAFGLVAHLLGVRAAGRWWSPTRLARRLPIVDLSALLAVLMVLAMAEWLLVQLGWVLPPVFAMLTALIAVGLCHWHSRSHLADILVTLTRRASDDQLKAEVDVFVSYSHEPGNAAWVEREIVTPLRAMKLTDGRTLRLFFDKGSITVGQDWFRRINLSMLGSRSFLCVWSDDYLERDYCRWELDYAFPRAARRDFLFLPVACLATPPGSAYAQYLQVRQYVDARSGRPFIEEIEAALRAHLDGART